MAAGANPIQAMLAQQLVSRLAQQRGGPMTGSAGTNENAGGQLSSQFSQLQGADPQMLVRELTSMKQKLGAMVPHVIMRVPKMQGGLSAAIKGIDAAIEAANKAAQTLQAVAPIANSAASPMQPETGAPSPMPMGL